MSKIHLPGKQGVPINPYPTDLYEQQFACANASENCKFVLAFQIPVAAPPNALFLFKVSDYTWRCPKCGLLQTTQQDLPRSTPLDKMSVKLQAGSNGSDKKKRKRKGKGEL